MERKTPSAQRLEGVERPCDLYRGLFIKKGYNPEQFDLLRQMLENVV
jgi:hypothetical protein